MSRVARPCAGGAGAPAGQPDGGVARWPGVLEYRHKVLMPNPTKQIQRARATTGTGCFFKRLGNFKAPELIG
jgi:hypothetical protein